MECVSWEAVGTGLLDIDDDTVFWQSVALSLDQQESRRALSALVRR